MEEIKKSRPLIHVKAESGEWIKQKQSIVWKCCDCGLEHIVNFRIGDDGTLEVSMERVEEQPHERT